MIDKFIIGGLVVALILIVLYGNRALTVYLRRNKVKVAKVMICPKRSCKKCYGKGRIGRPTNGAKQNLCSCVHKAAKVQLSNGEDADVVDISVIYDENCEGVYYVWERV